MNRENIYNALFAKLSTAAQFTTSSRRAKMYSDVSPADMPALFTVEKGELIEQRGRGLLPVAKLQVDVAIYIAVGLDPNVIPATELNNLLDSIDTALAPDDLNENVQTLGGLVKHCWISGEILKSAGDLDGQGIAIIPIEILLLDTQ